MPINKQIQNLQKLQGVNQPLRPVGIWRAPTALENEYVRFQVSFMRGVEDEVKKIIIPQISTWMQESKLDALDEDLDSIINSMKKQFDKQIDSNRTSTIVLANQIDGFNAREWTRILKRVAGVSWFNYEPWREKKIASWVHENTRLIKTIKNKALDDTEHLIRDGILQGKRVETIKREIVGIGELKKTDKNPYSATKSAFTKAKNNAERIAVDQVGKLNSKLTENRQVDLGINKYIWRNMQDRRVRGNPIGLYPNSKYNHWSREGKMYSWDSPPADGHPGYPIRCRCFAEPVFED